MAQPSPLPGEPRLPDARRCRRGRGRRAGGVPATGSRTDLDDIDDVRGWLTVVAGRLCLDQLRSARARHERPENVDSDDDDRGQRRPDPADRVTLDDEVRDAMLEVLRRLSPGERVSFVLHDVFQMPFEEIADDGRAARRHLPPTRATRTGQVRRTRRPGSPTSPMPNISSSPRRFITACANGDLEALTAVLDPAVWGVGTVLGEGAPPPQVNHGPDAVGRNLLRYLGTWRDACQRTGRRAGSARLRRTAAVRRHRAHDARQPRSQDRSKRRPNGSSPTVEFGRAAPAYSVVVEPNSSGGISTVSIMYTCALAVETPPHTTDASLTLRLLCP